jgi:hypothetical protein
MDISQRALMGLLGITDRNIVHRAIEQHKISWTVDNEGKRRIRRLVFGLAKAAIRHDSVQSSRFDDLLYARDSNDDARGRVELGQITAELSAKDAELGVLRQKLASAEATVASSNWRNVELRTANEKLVRGRAEAEANVRRLRAEVGKANATISSG